MERMLESVTRRVIWGDLDEVILESLAAQVCSIDEASRLLRDERRERVKSIPAIYWPRMTRGLVFIAVGVGLIGLTWTLTKGYTVWSSRAVMLPAAPAAFGVWRLLGGLIGILTASSRTGSVAD
ncbi:MAG: hypothetical protein KGQ89_06070, partial [Verrucomicrobia bacterium]|nr:hypothetical protein [Verrucomicrobiota bacterium]